MLERSGISGLGAEGEVYGPPTPEKKGIDWGGMVESLMKRGGEVAGKIMEYRLGKEAIKVQASTPPVKAPVFLPMISEEEGFPWMTVAIVGVVALGGYFLARRFKFI